MSTSLGVGREAAAQRSARTAERKFAMDPKRWRKPVTIELGKTGRMRAVSSTQEAAELLLMRWPQKGGIHHLLARIACLAVLEGEMPPRHARAAFIKACEEAEIFIQPE